MSRRNDSLPYSALLDSKRLMAPSVGFDGVDLPECLFPFQRDLVGWAIRKGRAALFTATGTGKTLMQLAWCNKAGDRPLIVAPLGVVQQTIREGERFGFTVKYAERGEDVSPRGIAITNYERLDAFHPELFDAVALDESSILKDYTGKRRSQIIEMFAETPMRLACTATPSPNDIAEIANHAQFLGLMTREGMLATFFVHDQDGWRLKRPAQQEFWRWLSSWGMFVRKPSDLGYDDDGYDLPPLDVELSTVPCEFVPDGQLFATGLKGVGDRVAVRKQTLAERVQQAHDLIMAEPDEPWIAWCGLNDEGRELAKLLGDDAVLVEGKDSAEFKADALYGFSQGKHRVLITKLRIAGMGMNFQHCARQCFVGLSDSFEAYYQGLRRSWRFGQDREVKAYIVVSDLETAIFDNVQRKQGEFERTVDAVVANVDEFQRDEVGASAEREDAYMTDDATGNGWRLMLGDSCERMAEMDDESVDLSIFSPPFLSLFQYSNSPRDLGNCDSPETFWHHFRWVSEQLLRVMKPGRNVCVHVANTATTLAHHGYIGLQDFRGMTIAHFVDAGFVYHGEVCIDKNPQAQAIRTHAKGLLFVQKNKDSVWSRPGLADYILVFRAPGESETPVVPDVTNEEWITWAHPLWHDIVSDGDVLELPDGVALASGMPVAWYGIRESDTLNTGEGKGQDDERHICPLQLGTIARCVRLWSNPGETVFTPFAGIGSEVYEAVRLGREAVGIELKESYWRAAVKNARRAESLALGDLFAWADKQDESEATA